MAATRNRPERERQAQRRLALLSSFMIPLLVLAGLLAPGVVQVMAQSTERVPAIERPPLVQTAGPLERRPLLVPRDFSSGFLPELVDFERLFEGQRYRLASNDQSNALPSFPRHHGDSIVLDDVGPVVEQVAFGDALITGAPTHRRLVEPDDSFFALCGVLPAANCVRFDDFTSGGGGGHALVPEPSSGLMMALGLVMLAVAGRRQRTAPS